MYENRWKTLQCRLSAYDIDTTVHNPVEHVKAFDHAEEAPQKVSAAPVCGTEKSWTVKTRPWRTKLILNVRFPLKQYINEWIRQAGLLSCLMPSPFCLGFQEGGGESFSTGAIEKEVPAVPGGPAGPWRFLITPSTPCLNFFQLPSTPRVRIFTETQIPLCLRKFYLKPLKCRWWKTAEEVSFVSCWGSNPGPCICQASVLKLSQS